MIAPSKAVTGMVSTQAQTIFLASAHLTALNLFEAPTPIIADEITCVVLTGAPMDDAASITAAAAVCAAKPPIG